MTSGYRVYRHNGWYHVYYNHCNSHPDGLGQWTIAEIPKQKRAYEHWLHNARRKLDQSFKTMSKGCTEPRDIYGHPTFQYYITRLQPKKSVRIQWIWEIDCDNEVLHVDSRPFFRLDHVPRGDLFLSSISLDNYGHRACLPSVPQEHRHHWKAKPPPVCPVALEKYSGLLPASKVLSPRSLFGLPDHPGSCEQVRCGLYQTMVGAALRTQAMAHDVPLLEQASSASQISDNLVELGRAMLHIALQPMIFCKFEYHLSRPVTCSQERFQWLRPDVCVQFSTHLDDEHTLQACLATLASKVEQHANASPFTYAIALSFTHISIARISTRNGATHVTHTPSLEFLPSFFATAPSNPGIAALVALSMILDNSHMLPPQLKRRPRKTVELPVEIWRQIATHVSSCSDLKNLAVLSPQSRSAAQDMLRYPHIAGHRLLRALPDPIDPLWVCPRWYRTVQEDYLPREGLQTLYSQKFDASCDDNFSLTVQVAPGDPPLRPLTRSWSERASTVAGFVKEGQFDLIPIDGIHKSGWTVKYGISPNSLDRRAQTSFQDT